MFSVTRDCRVARPRAVAWPCTVTWGSKHGHATARDRATHARHVRRPAAHGIAVSRLPWLVLAVLGMSALAYGQSASSSSSPGETAESILLRLSDRLSDEAQRQHQVNQRMDTVIDRFLAIIVDLQSNDLIKQANGPELERLVQTLKVLSTRHVPDAANYLEEARKQLAALRPNLVAADKEIEIILRELERILAAGAGAAEDLLRELEVIIQDEKRTHAGTREWGAQLLQNPDGRRGDPRKEIAAVQDRIAGRTARFMDRLRQAREAEKDPALALGMQRAHDVLQENKVPKLLTGAARDVEDKKPVAATQGQEDAIRLLEEAAKFLRPDDLASEIQRMKELRERLEAILKQQVELRETTEKVPPAEFPKEKNDLQTRERALDKEVVDAGQNLPPLTSPELKTHLGAADRHMQQAENRIASTEQPPAVESQKQAEKALQDALKTLDQDIANAEQAWQQQNQPMPNLADLAQKAMELAEKQRALKQETGQTQPHALPKLTPPQGDLREQAQALNQQLPMPQFQQAAQAMQQAAQSLQETQQAPAMQEQQKAIDALQAAAKALEQAQTAMDLAAQQMDLLRQTGQSPQGNLPKLAPPQKGLQQQTQAAGFQKAADFMQQAAQSLEQGQGQEAQEGQKAAIASLIGEAAQAMGMQPGQGQQPAPIPGMSRTPGMMPGLRAMPMNPAVNPREMGLRDFGRAGAGGTKKGGEDHWDPVGRRERESLYQQYARELPPEYRELLGEYYEALSKEAARAAPPREAPPAPAPSGEGKP